MLNYQKLKKNYLTVKLIDGTTLFIASPKKKQFDSLISLQEVFEDSEGRDSDHLDTMYRLCAELMSNNKGSVEITEDYMSEIFDIQDLELFLTEYMKFVNGETNQKN